MKWTCTLVALVIILCSCSRTIDCIDPQVQLAFVSVPKSTVDTLVIRKYEAGTNFATLVDSFRVDTANSNLQQDADAVILYMYGYKIKPGFDWQVYIPAANRTVSITAMVKRDLTTKCGPLNKRCGCEDEFVSAQVDNRPALVKRWNRLEIK
jgi:hypothetical protein